MTLRALLLIFTFLPYALTFPCADHPLCDETCSCTGYHFKRIQFLGDGAADHSMLGHFLGLKWYDHSAEIYQKSTTQFYLDSAGILWIRAIARILTDHDGHHNDKLKNHMFCLRARNGMWVETARIDGKVDSFFHCNTTTDGGNMRFKWLPDGKLSTMSNKCLGQTSRDNKRVIATHCDGSHSSYIVGQLAWESCPNNTYFNNNRSIASLCTSATAGHAACTAAEDPNTFVSACEACPPGMISAAAPADDTHPGCHCPANTYSNSSACVECPPASSSPPGSGSASSCVCNRGYTGPDGSVCVACSAGKFKASLGSQVCSMCEAGKNKASAGVNTVCEIVGHTARVTIRLPYTVAEFDTVKQAAYREAMASAAGTVTANVDIVQIEGGRISAHDYSPGVRVRTRMR